MWNFLDLNTRKFKPISTPSTGLYTKNLCLTIIKSILLEISLNQFWDITIPCLVSLWGNCLESLISWRQVKMAFPAIKHRKPDCDISINAQVTAANWKAKKCTIKEGWQKLSLETLVSVSAWENTNPEKTCLYFYTISSHQWETTWNLKQISTFQSSHQFLKQRYNLFWILLDGLQTFRKDLILN